MKPRWDPGSPAAASARAVLPGIVKKYLAEGRKAARENASPADLHRFRLATKKLRYTLEIFAPLYGPGLNARLKRVRAVQQALGELQDLRATSHLAGVAAHPELLKSLRRRITLKRAAFRRVWAAEFGALHTERDWLSYLDRYAKIEKD